MKSVALANIRLNHADKKVEQVLLVFESLLPHSKDGVLNKLVVVSVSCLEEAKASISN